MPSDRFEFRPDSRPPREEFEEESWTEVEGGGLEHPIYVRLARSTDGRRVITGMVLGSAIPQHEITASSLRKVRIGAILEQLFDGFDEDPVPAYDDFEAQIEWGLMHQTYDLGAPQLATESRVSERGAQQGTLEAFADRYRLEFEKNPRRAMTATAEALHISRATANRWAEKARQARLLPQREGGA